MGLAAAAVPSLVSICLPALSVAPSKLIEANIHQSPAAACGSPFVVRVRRVRTTTTTNAI
jgi:hypothetical protein